MRNRTIYKTTTGLEKACERFISDMEGRSIDDQREYEIVKDRLDILTIQCDALWSNPEDVRVFADFKYRMIEAWNAATD